MKNKKYIWIGSFVLSILLLTYSYKDIKLYYYVKIGNKNYYSKNYEKAIEYYEKALKIKEDYNICLLYTSPSPRDLSTSRMPSSA